MNFSQAKSGKSPIAMSPIFDKLNLKQQQEILLLNSPDTFEKQIATLGDVKVLRRLEEVNSLLSRWRS